MSVFVRFSGLCLVAGLAGIFSIAVSPPAGAVPPPPPPPIFSAVYTGFSASIYGQWNGARTDYMNTGFGASGSPTNVCGEVAYDVALRYAGEFSGFRVAAGVPGSSATPYVGVSGGTCSGMNFSSINPGNLLPHTTNIGQYWTAGGRIGVLVPLVGPGSGANVPTGLFNPSYVRMQVEGGALFGNVQIQVPGLVGADQQLTGSYFGGRVGVGFPVWGTGVTQSIDNAALELFVGFRHHDMGGETAILGGGTPIQTKTTWDSVLFGSTIRF